jgi:hypothetical protein
LNQAVDPFKDAIGYSRFKPLEDTIPVAFNGVGGLYNRLQTAVSCPEIPFFQQTLRPFICLVEYLLKVQLDMIGATGFQVEFLQSKAVKLFSLFFSALQLIYLFSSRK